MGQGQALWAGPNWHLYGSAWRLKRVVPDDLYELSHVGLNDTSFKKFNLNFFYKKWILDFELDPNIWIGFKYWSKYLDLDFKKIQTTFAKKMDLGRKSNLIIWI